MDRSQQSVPTVFLAGCLFALLIVAIELWPAGMGRGVDRPIDGAEQWTLAGDNIPHSNHDNTRWQQAPFVNSSKYAATIRAEDALSDRASPNNPAIMAVAAAPVREPETVIPAPIPSLTNAPTGESSSTHSEAPIKGPALTIPLVSPKATQSTSEQPTELGELQLPHEFESARPDGPLVTKSNDVAPPATANAIVPSPYSARSNSSAWPRLPALQQQLQELRHGEAQTWSDRVSEQLAAFQQQPEICNEKSQQLLTNLRQLISSGKHTAARMKSVPDRATLRRTLYSLERRVAVWTQIFRCADPKIVAQLSRYEQQLSREPMLNVLQAVESDLANHPNNWKRFLSLSHIRDVAVSDSFVNIETRASVAMHVLNRLNETDFSSQQEAIVNQPSVVALAGELRKWVTARIDATELLANIEEYEIEPIDSRGQLISSAWNRARWSLFPTQQKLAQTIGTHYRNSNVRLAISEEFLNRLVPAIQDVQAPVREQILGADVCGRSETSTRFRVNLVPDKTQIRMLLEGDGVMSAATRSTKGGVTLMNRNHARFFVQKILLMGPRGVKMLQSQSAATGSTNLTGLRTRFDTLPIIGSIVRRAAQKKAFESKARANMEFESRVASKARSQMDNRLQDQVAIARQRMEEKIIEPLNRMQLNPAALAMETTENRMTLRSRLASDYQLASFTSRPQARADSLFSVQIHDSALNNFVTQLQLSRKEGDLQAVFQEVAKQLGMDQIEIPEDIPEGVKIRFAKQDPVRFEFRDGRILIAFRIDGLKYQRRSWRNFEVRAYYTPKIDGFRCDLHRDEYIELIGKRLKSRHQIALRGIFTKVFSKSRPITLIHPEIGKDRRLAMLDVSQFVIRDGWVGVSVGHHPKKKQLQTTRRHQPNRR